MGVYAILVVEIWILEIVGNACDCRPFPSGLRVKVSVPTPAVDRHMAKAKIYQPIRVVSSDRKIDHSIDHVIVDALIPAQRRLEEYVPKGSSGIAHAPLGRKANRSQGAGNVRVHVSLSTPV